MDTKKTKPAEAPAVPTVCVCGAEPCIVNHKKRHMVCCPKTLSCTMRSRWQKNEQAAIKEWNDIISSTKHAQREAE